MGNGRRWIEERYRKGWSKGYADEGVKIFQSSDFACHKVSVVFWQLDEHDQPVMVTEPYEKAFTAANLKKEQEFYDRDLTFRVRVSLPSPGGRGVGGEGEKTLTLTIGPKDNAAKKFKALMEGNPEVISVAWGHPGICFWNKLFRKRHLPTPVDLQTNRL